MKDVKEASEAETLSKMQEEHDKYQEEAYPYLSNQHLTGRHQMSTKN